MSEPRLPTFRGIVNTEVGPNQSVQVYIPGSRTTVIAKAVGYISSGQPVTVWRNRNLWVCMSEVAQINKVDVTIAKRGPRRKPEVEGPFYIWAIDGNNTWITGYSPRRKVAVDYDIASPVFPGSYRAFGMWMAAKDAKTANVAIEYYDDDPNLVNGLVIRGATSEDVALSGIVAFNVFGGGSYSSYHLDPIDNSEWPLEKYTQTVRTDDVSNNYPSNVTDLYDQGNLEFTRNFIVEYDTSFVDEQRVSRILTYHYSYNTESNYTYDYVLGDYVSTYDPPARPCIYPDPDTPQEFAGRYDLSPNYAPSLKLGIHINDNGTPENPEDDFIDIFGTTLAWNRDATINAYTYDHQTVSDGLAWLFGDEIEIEIQTSLIGSNPDPSSYVETGSQVRANSGNDFDPGTITIDITSDDLNVTADWEYTFINSTYTLTKGLKSVEYLNKDTFARSFIAPYSYGIFWESPLTETDSYNEWAEFPAVPNESFKSGGTESGGSNVDNVVSQFDYSESIRTDFHWYASGDQGKASFYRYLQRTLTSPSDFEGLGVMAAQERPLFCHHDDLGTATADYSPYFSNAKLTTVQLDNLIAASGNGSLTLTRTANSLQFVELSIPYANGLFINDDTASWQGTIEALLVEIDFYFSANKSSQYYLLRGKITGVNWDDINIIGAPPETDTRRVIDSIDVTFTGIVDPNSGIRLTGTNAIDFAFNPLNCTNWMLSYPLADCSNMIRTGSLITIYTPVSNSKFLNTNFAASEEDELHTGLTFQWNHATQKTILAKWEYGRVYFANLNAASLVFQGINYYP